MAERNTKSGHHAGTSEFEERPKERTPQVETLKRAADAPA